MLKSVMCVEDHKGQTACNEKTKLGVHLTGEFPPTLFCTTVISFMLSLFFFFFGCACSMQKFLGEGSNQATAVTKLDLSPLGYLGTPVISFFLSFSIFLGLHLWPVEVPKLGVKSVL